jgi:hypothetical protein
MTRWFRHYTGMMRDPKLVGIAARLQQPVERVAFVWGCILEDASETQGGGAYTLDIDEIGYFLRCAPDDIAAIHIALHTAELVEDGIVIKWSERQYETDTSAERTRKYREKKRHGDGDVTSQPSHVTPPETETETETEAKKESTAPARGDDWPANWFDMFWEKYPNKVGRRAALKALERPRKRGVPFFFLMAGLDRYIHDKPPDRPWCNPATWVNQERWTDQPAAVIPISRGRGNLSEAASHGDAIAEHLRTLEGDGWSHVPAIGGG